MNLAEFPFALLRNRGDGRNTIVHESRHTDKDGNRYKQKWIAEGGSAAGLPTEYDERVLIALLGITQSQGNVSRKVSFSTYQLLKILGGSIGKSQYLSIKNSLRRLTKLTIESENAFWDHATGKRITTSQGFHLIDRYWLRYEETDDEIRMSEGEPAYIVWGDRIWKNIEAGYIKPLDLDFFNSLTTPLARRLYRLLDKRMHRNKSYEIDVFELSSRLGMSRYKYPSRVISRLQSALEELIEKEYLISAETVKVGKYTRLHFEREVVELPGEAVGKSGLVERLKQYGVAATRAQSLVLKFKDDEVIKQIDVLEWRLDPHTRSLGRPIENPAAWLIRAIEQDFQPPTNFVPRAQRESARAEQVALMEQADESLRADREQREKARTGRLQRLRKAHGSTEPEREQATWRAVQVRLEERFPKTTYKLYLAPVEVLAIRDAEIVLGFPNTMVREWVRVRAETLVIEACTDEIGEPVTIHYALMTESDETSEPETA